MKAVIAWTGALLLALTCDVAGAAAPPTTPNEASVRALVKQLDDDDFKVRQRAEQALSRSGKVVLPLLRRELARGQSLEVRTRLQRVSARLTKPVLSDKALRALVQQLASDRFEDRETARQKLFEAGKRAIPFLKNGIKSTDLEISVNSQRILRRILGKP
jgi:hypothetical protein